MSASRAAGRSACSYAGWPARGLAWSISPRPGARQSHVARLAYEVAPTFQDAPLCLERLLRFALTLIDAPSHAVGEKVRQNMEQNRVAAVNAPAQPLAVLHLPLHLEPVTRRIQLMVDHRIGCVADPESGLPDARGILGVLAEAGGARPQAGIVKADPLEDRALEGAVGPGEPSNLSHLIAVIDDRDVVLAQSFRIRGSPLGIHAWENPALDGVKSRQSMGVQYFLRPIERHHDVIVQRTDDLSFRPLEPFVQSPGFSRRRAEHLDPQGRRARQLLNFLRILRRAVIDDAHLDGSPPPAARRDQTGKQTRQARKTVACRDDDREIHGPYFQPSRLNNARMASAVRSCGRYPIFLMGSQRNGTQGGGDWLLRE